MIRRLRRKSASEPRTPTPALYTRAQIFGPETESPTQTAIGAALLHSCDQRWMQMTVPELHRLPSGTTMFVWDAFLMELAHLRTGERRYLDHALGLLRALPNSWRETSGGREIFGPFVVAFLVRFRALEEANLTDEDRELLVGLTTEITEHIWSDFHTRDYGQPERTPWNHSMIVSGAIGLAGLTLVDHPDHEAWFASGVGRLREFLDVGVTTAGMTYEGLLYCGWVFKILGPLLNGLRLAGQEGLVAPEGSPARAKLHRVPVWYAHDTWPRGRWLQNYNDSPWDPHSAVTGLLVAFAHYEPELCAAVWSRLVGAHGAATYGAHVARPSLADSVLHYPPGVEPDLAVLEQLDRDFFCPEAGYLVTRDRWTTDASVFTFNCGALPCELHDQSDNLSFTYIGRGNPVVIDSGPANKRVEGSASTSGGHNLVFIDGIAEAPAGERTYLRGAILGVELTDSHVSIIGDATESYAHEDYNPVRHATRQAVFVRGPEPYLLLFDDIDKDGAEHNYEVAFHVPAEPQVIGDAEITVAWNPMADEPAPPATTIAVLHPEHVEFRSGTFDAGSQPLPTHFVGHFGATARNPQFVTLVHSAPPRGVEVVRDGDDVRVRLSWADRADEIRFRLRGVDRPAVLPTLHREG